MMNMVFSKVIIIILFSVFLPFFLSAQQKNTASPSTVSTAPKQASSNVFDNDDEIDKYDVEEVVMKVIDKLKKEKESEPVPVTLITSYSNKFTRFSKYPRIEPNTRISILWYKNVSESLFKLAEIKIKIEVATFNKEKKQFEELSKAYKESVTKIIHLLENPQKISDRK